jgi:hypothetical protein
VAENLQIVSARKPPECWAAFLFFGNLMPTQIRRWAMDTRQDSTDARLRTRLFNKLTPENFRQMSGTTAAVLGFLLDAAFVRPSITAITITSDGYLLADTDEPRFGCFLGDYKDLIRSWAISASSSEFENRRADVGRMLVRFKDRLFRRNGRLRREPWKRYEKWLSTRRSH